MKIKPIKSTTVQDQVYQELFQAIVSGRIAPGVRVTIEGLAKHLNVSLMPVRVALQKLEVSGFVTIGKNRRIRVNELNQDALDEILEIRLLIECRAAEKACLEGSPEGVEEIEELYVEFEKIKDAESYLLLNREFHETIYRQAKMPILEEIISSLWDRVSPYLYIFAFADSNWQIESYDRHHHGMLTAIKEKDPKAMTHWLTEDFMGAAKLIKEAMETARGGQGEQSE